MCRKKLRHSLIYEHSTSFTFYDWYYENHFTFFTREGGGRKKKTGLRDLHSKVIKSQCDVSFLSFRPRYINLRYMITTIWCTYSILYIPYNSTLHLWDWFDGVNAMDALNRSFNYCRFYESSTLSKITLR